MDQIFDNPLTLEVEKIGETYFISLTFKDKENINVEAKFVCGNIFINKKVKMGFDAPETFETYYDCTLERVTITELEEVGRYYLDIYVKTD